MRYSTSGLVLFHTDTLKHAHSRLYLRKTAASEVKELQRVIVRSGCNNTLHCCDKYPTTCYRTPLIFSLHVL